MIVPTLSSHTCHEIIHVLLVERDDLDLSERVECLVQLPPVEQVEEGGQVQQQEQGRRSVPPAVYSCTTNEYFYSVLKFSEVTTQCCGSGAF
jgi:hypothetical protein